MGKSNRPNMRAVTLTQSGRLIIITVLDNQSDQFIDNLVSYIKKLYPKRFGSYDILINFYISSACEDTINQVIKAIEVLSYKRIAVWSNCTTNLRNLNAVTGQIYKPDKLKIFTSESKALQWINKSTINSVLASTIVAASGKN